MDHEFECTICHGTQFDPVPLSLQGEADRWYLLRCTRCRAVASEFFKEGGDDTRLEPPASAASRQTIAM